MAFYRFEAQIISRGAQRSAVAAAAYRSGERLTDEKTGRVFDYKSRHGVQHAEIVYPDGAPKFASREQLWNAVERSEVRADAQLAREMLLSLPHQLSVAESTTLVREFIREQLTHHGVVVDWVLHGPDRRGDLRNIHVHAMMTLRPLREDGTFGSKTELRHMNAKVQLLHWREAWEQHVNRALERAELRERVSCAAHRVENTTPEPKQGPLATELERAGRRTYAGDDRRAARREREHAQRRERERVSPRRPAIEEVRSLGARVRDAMRGISPLILPIVNVIALGIEHPARDRWWEFRRELRSEDHARHSRALAHAGWNVTQRENAMIYRKGRTEIENEGGRVRVHGPMDANAVKATLDTIQANGWTTLRIRDGGAPNDRVALILAAFDRGIEVLGEGKNRELVAELKRVHDRGRETRDVGDRVRERATAPAAERSPSSRRDSRDNERSERAFGASGQEMTQADRDAVAVDEAFQLLTQQSAAFTRQDLEKTLERFAPTPERLADLLVAARNSESLVELGMDARGTPRYTTQRMFALETRFMEDALAKAKLRLPQTEETLSRLREQIKSENPTLTEHQAAAFDTLTSGAKLVMLRGVAGGGKSYLMGLVREFYERLDMSVHGDALAGVAADGLAKESGITDSRTTAQWRCYFESNPSIPNSVHVGDEKGMAGTEDIDVLLRKFDVTVLVGDQGQLQPISAGAPFRALMDRLPKENVAELSEVRRQKIEWQAEATRLFYDGKPRDALKLYEQNDRWVKSETRDEAKEKIVAAWRADAAEFPEHKRLVLAYTRADVLDLNSRLRAVRRELGELAGPDVTFEMTDGPRTIAINERVLFREPGKFVASNGEELKIRNGTAAIVAAIDEAQRVVTLRIPEMNDKLVPVKLDEYRSIDYADANTTHTAQGKTVDRAYFLATSQRGMSSDLVYVGMSRQKHEAQLYWSVDQFKNEAQVYRTLTRMTPKDFSLDYSRDAANMGLGLPNQSSGAVAMRAPYQVRSELLQVVRTASHLRDIAPEAGRAQAESAYKGVRAWYYRVDKDLRELEARDIRGIAITGYATTLSERLALLEKSVSTAAALSTEQSLGRTEDRFADLRADVVRLRAEIGQRRGEAQQTLGESIAPLLVPPPRAIADELAALSGAVEAAVESQIEHEDLAALDATAAGSRGAAGLEARQRAAEIREHIHMRQIAAQHALEQAQHRYADPHVLESLQAAYESRLAAYSTGTEEKAAAAELIAAYDRQDADLAVVAEQLDALSEHGALSHVDLDRIAASLAPQRRTADREAPEAGLGG